MEITPKERVSDGFCLVNDPIQLLDVIKFLERGYEWDATTSEKLYEKLRVQLAEFPAAAAIFKNGQLSIAALLFYQGLNHIESKTVINFSNWYALESSRGIDVIRFAADVTRALEGSIITCYTPKYAVCKILKALKYKDMSVKKTIIGLSDSGAFIKLRGLLNLLTLSNDGVVPDSIESLTFSSRTELYYKIHSVKKFGFTLSVLTLVTETSSAKVNILWLLSKCVRHGILRLNVYEKSPQCSADVWLVKNTTGQDFISPIGSEYMV